MLRTSEWVVLAYVGYILVTAWVRPLPRARRAQTLAWGTATAVAVVAEAKLPAWPAAAVVRDLAPALYILFCYHLSGRLFLEPQPAVEERFTVFDAWVQRLFGMPESVARAPRLLLEFLEGTYFACYAVVPAGCYLLLRGGQRAQVDRYWTFVLLATLACYAVLPWIRTRPPWALEEPGPMNKRPVLLRSLNRFVNGRASIQVNTSPSAHTASALATALAVLDVWPEAGAGLLFIAASIAAATVVGRYHYAGDSLAAVAATMLAWGVVAVMPW